MANSEEIIINIDVEGASSAEKSIDDVTKSLEKNTEASEETTEANEEYSNSLIDGVKNTKVFGVSINDLSKGFKATTGTIRGVNIGLKAFKTALIATGIGAIVVALGSLVAVFTKTQGGIDLVTKAMDAFGVIIDVVIDRFIKFGNGLIEFFKGNFSEGIDQMASSFSGIVDEISAATTASLELSDAFAQLERDKVKNIVTDAKLRAEAAALFEITKDETVEIGKRIKAAEQLAVVENKRAAEAERIAGEELRILKARNELATSTLDDLRLEAEAEARLFQLREESSKRQIKSFKELQTLKKQIIIEDVADETARAAGTIKITETTANAEIAIETDKFAALIKLNDDYQKGLEDNAAARVALAELGAKQEFDAYRDLAGGLAELAGQETAAGKLFAIAQATMNMQEGITRALNALTLPGRIAGVAFAITTGLNAIKQIQSTPIPKVQIASSPFADGGPIAGPSHNGGGVWLNAEGGEYIINKTAMRDPINRRMVEAINDGKQSRGTHFQSGGMVNAATIQLMNLEKAMQNLQPVLILPDLDRAQNVVKVTEEISTLQ